ncbi:MAG: DUF58 domain-containing protein [Bacteroidales bacterium]|nr:DUF58 domain-containing protein [Bacteroidales bacterium]
MAIIRNIHLPDRFFGSLGISAALMAAGFWMDFLYFTGLFTLMLTLVLSIIDIILLYKDKEQVLCNRTMAGVWSLNAEHQVNLTITNKSRLNLWLEVFDHIPDQFQKRDKSLYFWLKTDETKRINYNLQPKTRGEYKFGACTIIIRSLLGMAERKLVYEISTIVKVMPSIVEKRAFELNLNKQTAIIQGVRKIRRIGSGSDFEEIKQYLPGDDYRKINWKATSRSGNLMVNVYDDEKSQQVYSIVDVSRSMWLSYNNMALYDYAINTSLVILNTALQKQDKAGLITFSDDINKIVKAGRERSKISAILESLYNVKESKVEANYEKLYHCITNVVRFRSLIFLYMNFESLYALRRVLPILRQINKQHLLVVMFFDNMDLREFAGVPAKNLEDIYQQTIARKFLFEKIQIEQELKKYGIQVIMNKPDELSANSVNKYLELKSRGLV